VSRVTAATSVGAPQCNKRAERIALSQLHDIALLFRLRGSGEISPLAKFWMIL
jgi:hypothetical protein